MFILSLVGVAFETLKLKGGYIRTGSFPSIASIHSRLLASDRACRVMTPCLRERERATSSRFNLRGVPVPLCHLPVSPLNHLNVKTEAFVDRLPLSSDARAQPEHLRSDVHHAVLLSGREANFGFCITDQLFMREFQVKKKRPVCNKVSKSFSPDWMSPCTVKH